MTAAFACSLVAASAVQGASIVPAPPNLSSASYLVIDADTGKVIAERNSRESMPPASLTKVMTGYVAAGEIEGGRIALNDKVSVSVNAWRTPGSRMFIQEGTEVSVEDLLRGIIIQSGNDASVALAEHIAGSEAAFADMMNRQAAELGMVNSNFRNATGLPAEDHYTTAWDLAALTRAYIQQFPENYALNSERSFTYNDIEQPNRNRLLWRDRTVDGVKTGYTKAAGYCLLASAEREGMRLISVVMGADNDAHRVQESQMLLSYGFRFFETKRLYEADAPLESAEVWYGQADAVELGVAAPVTITFPRGHYDQVAVEMTLPEVIEAPIQAGDALGELRVSVNEETLHSGPLIALSDVAEAGIFAQLGDYLTLLFRRIFG
ncbi:MAG: D-alanyl-D-alanine carboxypeptidase [Gammaproteobacteria bacterium]|nr:D-alanyl-D-alanine carboxypeptidase [Gammaproteobacteria bacterium]